MVSRLQASSDSLEVVNFTVWLQTPEGGCSLGERRSYDSLLNMKAYCSANGVLGKRSRFVLSKSSYFFKTLLAPKFRQVFRRCIDGVFGFRIDSIHYI